MKVPTGILTINDACYPKRVAAMLGRKAPKQLHYMGNLDLLTKKAVGFCGSRNASNAGLNVASDCATQLAANNVVVVSGYAAGVDSEAHYAALASHGDTIIVLAEGLDNFKIKKIYGDFWDWDRVLVLSQFPPEAGWKVFRAMERNSLIITLSQAMIVIEASTRGGTIEAGRASLKLGIPLFVVEYKENTSAPGNTELLANGAFSLKKSQASNSANISPVYQAMEKMLHHVPPPRQLLLT